MHLIKIIDFKNHTNNLFEFTTTRPVDFRFRAGEFAMIKIPGYDIKRAYSIGSPTHSDTLTWLSIVAPGGPFTDRLKDMKIGDDLLMATKAVGSLVFNNLTNNPRDLYLVSTGTGVTPWASIIGDEETKKFRNVIVIHSVRESKELVWEQRMKDLYQIWNDKDLVYIPTTTRERSNGLRSSRIQFLPEFCPVADEGDQVMVCGNFPFVTDIKAILNIKGFVVGSANTPGNFLYEKAFVG